MDVKMNLGVFLVALGACFPICSCFLNPHRFTMKYEKNMAKAAGRYGKSDYNADQNRIGGFEVPNRSTNLIRKERSFGKLKKKSFDEIWNNSYFLDFKYCG